MKVALEASLLVQVGARADPKPVNKDELHRDTRDQHETGGQQHTPSPCPTRPPTPKRYTRPVTRLGRIASSSAAT